MPIELKSVLTNSISDDVIYFDKFIHLIFTTYLSQEDLKANVEYAKGTLLEEEANLLLSSPAINMGLISGGTAEAPITLFDVIGRQENPNLPDRDPDVQFAFDEWVELNRKYIEIKTPSIGVKPDIAIQANFLPNEYTQGVTITVKNMMIDLDISQLSFMRVIAGYFSGHSLAFSGPIINSYIESPSPNGVTVFQMLDAGIVSSFVRYSEIVLEHIKYASDVNDEITIGRLILFYDEKIIHVDNRLPDELNEGIFISNIIHRINIASRIEAINVLRELLTSAFDMYNDNAARKYKEDIERGRNVEAPIILTTPMCTLTVAGLMIYSQDYYGKGDGTKDTMPVLDVVRSVTFTGGAVVIKGSWVPEIRPGYCFKISPVFFRGRLNSQSIVNTNLLIQNVERATDSATSNQVGASDKDVYRVNTLRLQFGTYNGNEMEITAVAVRDAKKDIKLQEQLRKVKEVIDELGDTTANEDVRDIETRTLESRIRAIELKINGPLPQSDTTTSQSQSSGTEEMNEFCKILDKYKNEAFISSSGSSIVSYADKKQVSPGKMWYNFPALNNSGPGGSVRAWNGVIEENNKIRTEYVKNKSLGHFDFLSLWSFYALLQWKQYSMNYRDSDVCPGFYYTIAYDSYKSLNLKLASPDESGTIARYSIDCPDWTKIIAKTNRDRIIAFLEEIDSFLDTNHIASSVGNARRAGKFIDFLRAIP